MNTDKRELRRLIRAAKRQFTEEQLADMSRPIIDRLLAIPEMTEARIILMYYSLPGEVNTRDAIDRLKALGKTVLLPRVTDGENMEIRVYEGRNDLAVGSYGIMEPVGKPFTEYDRIDVVVVPGMSFDRNNNRLGRGKGYYDRFLPKATRAYKIGVCFDFQKQEAIPATALDIRMDCVV